IHCGEQTQLLYGEPVYLLDRDEKSLLVQAADGYWGWVSTAAIRPMDEASFRAYTSHPRGAVVADIESGALRIPRGASLPVVGNDAGRIQVQLPTGELFPIAASAIRVDRTADSRARDRVRAALDLLQTPYLFGGRSPLGLDCSGLVTNVWRRVDLPCSRDAWQQALAGDMVATSWDREGLRAGDQVFFMGASGKIYHTGIALSTHHVLHAAAPGVQISSIKKGDRLYHARLDRDFFIAKRP
ncbi:MAG: C40 family peptidase, partial [Planctomycetes bacterium]|nr:C40 family peptidase [Planctomycetota bacterium]